MWKAILAAVVDNIGSVFNQVGFILQKKSTAEDNRSKSVILWLTGFSLLFAMSAVNVICIPYMDMALLSTTQATAIISGVIFSIVWLKEPVVCKYDVPALTIMTLGGVLLGIQTNKETEFIPSAEFGRFMLSTPACTYYTVFALLASAAFLSYKMLLEELVIFEGNVTNFAETHFAVQKTNYEYQVSQGGEVLDFESGFSGKQKLLKSILDSV